MSDSFTYTLPLKVSSFDEKILEKRLDAARQIYNASLGEALKRLRLCRESRDWQKASKLPKAEKKERKNLFNKAQQQYKFSEYSLHSWAKERKNDCSIKKHIDANTAQKEATKAFSVVRQHAIGKRGRPRFRGKDRFRSIEGKSNKSGIRFLEGKLIWNIKQGKSLSLCPIFDFKDPYGIEAHALCSKVKYCRLIRKTIRGKKHWFVQLVLEGKPLIKERNRSKKTDRIGIDIGPSTIATVSSTEAFLSPFCTELVDKDRQRKTLQRKMSRSLRLNNKENFDEKGAVKKGAKKWARSKRYLRLRGKKADLERGLSDHRKRLQGKLANQILQLGTSISLEKLSYKSFQKNFGKSVGFRAPGLFVSLLKRKAERAGGFVEEFSPYKTSLSQTCICKRKQKKKLSERWHRCPCGVIAQRDLFSAYLARFVEKDKLDISQAKQAWVAAQPLLQHAISRLNQQAIGKSRLASFGLGQRQSLSHAKENRRDVEAIDVVGQKTFSAPRAVERHLVSS